jgi:hypothetical protein
LRIQQYDSGCNVHFFHQHAHNGVEVYRARISSVLRCTAAPTIVEEYVPGVRIDDYEVAFHSWTRPRRPVDAYSTNLYLPHCGSYKIKHPIEASQFLRARRL